jgi:2-dehydropantoate 2-reductase
MRYVIYGAGAIGGVIAANLARAGLDVLVIARGPHLEAIQADGLHYASPNEELMLRLQAVGDPAEIDWTANDAALMCMKTQDAEPALDALYAAAGAALPVLCCQNGVANERMALRRFESVYAVVVMLPAAHLEPGSVVAQSKAAPGLLDLGCYPEGTDEFCRAVAKDLEAAGFSAQANPRVMRFKYAKLLMNLGNALQATCRAGEAGRKIIRCAREEALHCFDAANIDCASNQEFAERRADLIQPAPVKGSMRRGGSSWQSLARQSGSIEADYLNGEIALLGRLHGVATPVNAVLQQVANEVARAGDPPESFPVAELLERIRDAEARF